MTAQISLFLRTCFLLLGTGSLIFLLTGCDNAVGLNGTVSGVVMIDKQPLTGGTLILKSDSSLYRLPIAANGTFSQANVAVGTYQVAFETESVKNRLKNYMSELEPGAELDEETRQELEALKALKYVPIAPKYRKLGTSGFDWSITTGRNQRTFELQSK